ncbi:MAG: hypothetical protein LIR50_14965 [Bacillota bacterium]|nr:hypothetical protein [Bacillota bacterium]
MKTIKVNYDNVINFFGICENGDCYNLFNNHWWCNVLTGNSIGVKQGFIGYLRNRYNQIYTKEQDSRGGRII